jgi:2-keto-4-pentenoate hydratase
MVVVLKELAERMLADYDARMPSQLFVQAYALQAEIARLREQRGEKVIGYKVGCTSPVMQKQLAIGEPIFARIFDTDCFPCGAQLSYQRYANLAVEGELAVRLGEDLAASSSVGEEECGAAIAGIFPVIELHHFVLCSPQPSVVELIASGGMHAGLILAEDQAPPAALANVDHLRVWMDGACLGEVAGAELVRSAVQSLRWLAARLAEWELPLVRGQMILTGSLLNLYPVRPDNRISVDAPPLGRSTAAITA